jgi:acyl-CoA synthetase (AMP-forming)/AMP-acid ligase II/acyl carrier protein
MALDNFLNDCITEEDTYKYTLPEILQTRATYTPDTTAYIFLRDGDDDEERITYRELDQAARKIAYHLRLTGAAGDRALMLFPPGLEFVKALFGCFYAGVIAVPAYAPRKNRSLDRIKMLVVDSGSTLVLSNADISQAIERSFSDLDELKQMKWLIMEDITTDGNIDTGAGVASLPGEVALLQYTSGSTGQPKGVMVTHRNIMRNCDFIRSSFGFSHQSIGVSWLPTFHDMGLVGQIFQPVFTGFTSVLMPPVTFLQKPIRWMKAFSKYRGTMGGAPNFAFDLLADSTTPEEREGLDLSSIKTIYCGAEPIRKSTFDRFADVYKAYGLTPEMLYPCYGMAETTLITSGPPALRGPVYLCVSGNALEKNKVEQVAAEQPDARYLTGVGFPWLDTRVRIINPETLVQCNNEEVGEVWVTGSSVTYGYWNNPDITKAVFQSELNDEPQINWLRTGDLGFFNNGELYITGRLKDVIIIHGRNYYPQDIEFHTENSHPALQSNASAAFSVDVDNEEKLVIVAEVQRSFIRDLDVNSVCDAIREQISEEFELEVYAIQLLRTASILKTSSGKIQRKACRDGFLNKTLLVVGESINESASEATETGNEKPDITSLQAWLIAWIHIHLKIPFERIDQSKSISVYGLNSMKAVQLQQDVLTKFGVNIPPYVFFDKITVKELCERAFAKMNEIE